jgi:hypothetical protein
MMNEFPTKRVRPIVRILAGVLGVAFALAGLLAVVLTVYTVWNGIRAPRHIAWTIVAIGVLVPLGALSLARIFLDVAVTGENPRIDDGETEIILPAI